MVEIAKKCIEIGIIKDLYEKKILTEEQMNFAIEEIMNYQRRDENYEKPRWKSSREKRKEKLGERIH